MTDRRPRAVEATTYLAVAAGFVVSAFWSEWLFAATSEGLVDVSHRILSLPGWAIMVTLAGSIAWFRFPALRALVLQPWALGVAFSAASIGVCVMVLAIGAGDRELLLEGIEATAIVAAAIPLALLFTLGWPRSAWIVCAVAATAIVYAVAQFGVLPPSTNDSGWLIAGNVDRWWDSRAVYGTFATTGKNFFGNASALLAVTLLPWTMLAASRTARLCAAAGYAVLALLVVLSLSRSAVLAVAVSSAVILVSGVTRARLAGVASLVIAATLVAGVAAFHTSDGFSAFSRGAGDRSGTLRLEIWRDVLDTGPMILRGAGYGRANTLIDVDPRWAVSASEGGPDYYPTENLFLRRLAEGGALALLLLLGAVAMLFRQTMRAAHDPTTRPWNLALRGVVLAFCIQSLTTDTIFYDQSSALFATIVALLVAGASMSRSSPAFAS